jgi:hypothetical protein
MKKDWSHLENFRVRSGDMSTSTGDTHGQFVVGVDKVVTLCIIASSGMPEEGMMWEHVSVHARTNIGKPNVKMRTPTWDEMCLAKRLFWEDDEAAMQLHPVKSDYVNTHPHVLHLWKPIGTPIPTPPKIFV